MVVLRKRDTKGKFTTSPAGKCPEYGPDAPRRSPRINPNSPGIIDRIVKASQGKSPGGTDRPELADGKAFEEMKAEYEQGLKDVNPVTPPPKKTQDRRALRPAHPLLELDAHLHLFQVGLAGPRRAVNKPLVNCSRTGRNRGGRRVNKECS